MVVSLTWQFKLNFTENGSEMPYLRGARLHGYIAVILYNVWMLIHISWLGFNVRMLLRSDLNIECSASVYFLIMYYFSRVAWGW